MWLVVFILGLVIGSFLNAYLWRLHTGGSVWKGRSICPKCRKTLGWVELIPLVSFIIQKGRCRGCGKKIDWQYPLVELCTAVLFVLAYLQMLVFVPTGHLPQGDNFQFSIFNQFSIFQLLNLLSLFYFFTVLIILFVYDLRWGLVPDKVVLPGIVIAFILNIVAAAPRNQVTTGNLVTSAAFAIGYLLLAIFIGGGFFALQYYLSRGRWVGAGDIRFGALLGAMLGWPEVLVALFISYLIGGATASVLLLLGKKKFGQTLPMGVFLTLGAIIALLWGRQILNWYWPL